MEERQGTATSAEPCILRPPLARLPTLTRADPIASTRPIHSMTGYAQASRDTAAGQIAVDLRSVNSRFLDLTLRMPDDLRPAEPALREMISGAVQRGKLECRVSLRAPASGPSQAMIDPRVVEQLARLDASLRAALPDTVPLSVGELLRWPGVLAEGADAQSLVPTVLEAATEALAGFVASRAREGAKLTSLILERADAIESIADRIAARCPELLALHEQKLIERLQGALEHAGQTSGVPLDETMARVRQEVTLHGMRVDIDEEIGRLRAHLAELRRILSGPGPVGKRLDFLLQEFNREANTIGSKAAALEMTRASIDLKVLIEQIREQVQNLE
jgi:uncharacterized protein (TIGR00255 family)